MDREEGTRSVDADMVFHRGTVTFLETRRVLDIFRSVPSARRATATGNARIDGYERYGSQTHLLVTAAGLGHVALRALGLENLGACDGVG